MNVCLVFGNTKISPKLFSKPWNCHILMISLLQSAPFIVASFVHGLSRDVLFREVKVRSIVTWIFLCHRGNCDVTCVGLFALAGLAAVRHVSRDVVVRRVWRCHAALNTATWCQGALQTVSRRLREIFQIHREGVIGRSIGARQRIACG